MTRGEEIFAQLQAAAHKDVGGRGRGAPTQAYLQRHVLESFVHRLTLTEHAQDFVLKGGVLLSAYGARRPTKDVDANAVSGDVTPDAIAAVVEAIASTPVDDGVEFALESLSVEDIRDDADYPGFRVSIRARIAGSRLVATWGVSTGDPIVPAPRMIAVPRVLGEPIAILGYAKETVVAEKGVTILERGITSTRWRDYVDIVQLCADPLDEGELLRSARAVARYRQVKLEPVAPHLRGYGDIAQPKWAAWRSKQGLEEMCEANLDDQVAAVAAILDPIFRQGPDTA